MMDLDHNLDMSEPSDSETEVLDPTPVDELCLRCKSIFSSLQSLQSLVSEEGYKHYNKKEAQQHEDSRCPFCMEICSVHWAEEYDSGEDDAEENDSEGNDSEEDYNVPIYLKAAYNGTAIHCDLENTALYPSSILKMNTVVVMKPAAFHREIKIFSPYSKHRNSTLPSFVIQLVTSGTQII